MQMDKFSELKAFVSVVDLGSFSAASDQLGVTKSSISKKVSSLEARLSVKLLNRTTRRLSVTELGRVYYQKASKLLQDWDEADSLISQGNEKAQGMLKVTAPVIFGARHLSCLLKQYMDDNEEVCLSLDLNDKHVNIVEEGFDMAIRIGVLPDSNLVAKKLAPIKRQLYASQEYIEKNGNPDRPEELIKHSMLNHVSAGKHLSFADKHGDLHTVQPSVKLTVNNGDVLMRAVKEGMGISLLPTYLTTGACKRGELIPIMTNFHVPDFTLYAVYPQTRYLPSRVSKLINLLEDSFSGEPYWDA